MDDYNPISDHHFKFICKTEVVADSVEARRSVLPRHADKVAATLAELGFEHVSDALHEGADAPGHPQFMAELEGRPCCICFPEETGSVVQLQALSEEQCAFCAEKLPEHDVYHAGLFIAANDLYMLAPYLVRRGGEWLAKHTGAAQFLPPALRKDQNRYSALLGDAAAVKLFKAVMPHVMNNGRKVEFFIDGLNEGKELVSEKYFAKRIGPLPSLFLLVRRAESDESRICRPFFYCEHECGVELELVSVDNECPEDGLVELMTRDGRYLYAECLEAAALPGLLPEGRRYCWSLSVVAQGVGVVEKELVITQGAAYEEAVRDYRREHGEEPPEDFSLRFSMGILRSFQQAGWNSDVTFCGQVVELREEWMMDLHNTVVVLRFLPDHDETMLCMFISDAVLGDTQLAVGDTICGYGELYAVPSELVEDTASWQDSPELCAAREDEEREDAVQAAYAQYSKGSMALGVAVSAFLGGGWALAEPLPSDFPAQMEPMLFENAEGERVVVYMDSVLDGADPVFSCKEAASAAGAVYCRVGLEYSPSSDRYHVSMNTVPELPGVYSRLRSAASPMQHSILSINDDGTTAEEWVLPEQLDEYMAAGLLRAALEQGAWQPLAEWLREEATCVADFSHLLLTGKLDVLRHFGSSVSYVGASAFSCRVGCIRLGKARRAALAITIDDELQSYATFDNSHGMIGCIRLHIPTTEHNFRES